MTRDIQKWLSDFRKYWIEGDIDSLLALFTEDVDYYETPENKLQDLSEIREEWKSVKKQEEISLDFDVFSKDEDKYTVKWRLSYEIQGEKMYLNGIYLIRLDKNNRCFEFWQYCQNE